ncbi:MAG: hypothetical protein KAT04_09060 [Methylococcales bacterium]|nr:hypothetical protein [Methylococcales bacterium]
MIIPNTESVKKPLRILLVLMELELLILYQKVFYVFFDTFGYDRLGFGCYLHQGVCQLMGVEATEQGYYIIKGGGIPGIDVVAYNLRVNWNVLMQRLSRISSPE